jgi:hypothetical protein
MLKHLGRHNGVERLVRPRDRFDAPNAMRTAHQFHYGRVRVHALRVMPDLVE